jgi:hypothetical protein
MENKTYSIANILSKTETFIEINMDLLKLKMLKMGSQILSILIAQLIISGLLILLSLFASIGVAIYFNSLFNNSYIGYFLVASGYLFITLIVIIFRKALLIRPIQNSIIRRNIK